jgi:hypothetical protein
VAKNGRKVKAFKNQISGENWTKSNGYSLTLLLFLASFSKMK